MEHVQNETGKFVFYISHPSRARVMSRLLAHNFVSPSVAMKAMPGTKRAFRFEKTSSDSYSSDYLYPFNQPKHVEVFRLKVPTCKKVIGCFKSMTINLTSCKEFGFLDSNAFPLQSLQEDGTKQSSSPSYVLQYPWHV